jgi:protein-tyrosine phosphatase
MTVARTALPIKQMLLCTAAAALYFSVEPASAQQAITTPIFTATDSDQNFRDLAGIAAQFGGGYADTTRNSGVMRTGVFYRSEALSTGSLNSTDLATLTSMHIGLVLDLRTTEERLPQIPGPPNPMAPNSGPDQSIGAREAWVNIYGSYAPPTPPTTDATAATNYMLSTYVGFVANSTEVQAFRAALLELAHEEGSSLYHCSGGKDRTGWTSMLLQTIAGVSPQAIMKGYLATNDYMQTSVQAILSGITDANTKAAVAVLLGVKESYLITGLAEINTLYGSMWNYLTSAGGLGLTQEDIYVLRGKMVYYAMLPGQAGFVGNAAAGAAFLNALQNSPLSGRYTKYNYYLQSAIDAGTLGGVETQAGGQVHADAVAYALRLPVWLEEATVPYAAGSTLAVGQTRVWMTGMGEYFKSDGATGFASSTERTAGTVVGATYRIDAQTSTYFGLGYSSGSVKSAGASADVDVALASFGGRYGFSSLESGAYAAARAHLGWIDYDSERSLGGGLGIARGGTQGTLASTRFDVGYTLRIDQSAVTPQVGLRATHVRLGRFDESGSELALSMGRIEHTNYDLVTDLGVALEAQQWNGWMIVPSATLGYELALNDPQVASNGTLYDIAVAQSSAYDSRHLFKAGFAVMAERDAFTVKAGVNAARGDASSAGITAQASVAYRF